MDDLLELLLNALYTWSDWLIELLNRRLPQKIPKKGACRVILAAVFTLLHLAILLGLYYLVLLLIRTLRT